MKTSRFHLLLPPLDPISLVSGARGGERRSAPSLGSDDGGSGWRWALRPIFSPAAVFFRARSLRWFAGVGKAIFMTKPMVEEALTEIYRNLVSENMVVADLGCSSGPNTFRVISEVIDIISSSCVRLDRRPPEIMFLLNDLPGNDFNTIFQSLASNNEMVKEEMGERFVPYYVCGVPGSFHKRVFPRNSIHFVHSSCSLHWLSQVPRGLESDAGAPLHKKNIYIAKTTPSSVTQLYSEQYARDFTAFLKSRSEEIISGGRMVLSFLGRNCSDPASAEFCYVLGLLAEALNAMASEGLLNETMIDDFKLPIYIPSIDEVKSAIRNQGSFDPEEVQIFELNWDPFDDSDEDYVVDSWISGGNVAKYLRAGLEPLLVSHFGDVIMDDLFSRYTTNVAKHLQKEKTKIVVFAISLKLRG